MCVCGVYDASSAEYTVEIKNATDFYIEDFSQLPAISIGVHISPAGLFRIKKGADFSPTT